MHGGTKSCHTCGVVRCTEKLDQLNQVSLSGDQSNQSRELTSLSVYKNRFSGDASNKRWQYVASLTTQHPSLDRVSDSVKITGQLYDQQATVSLELVKAHDCLESQFSCVAVSTDKQGRTSVKKSIIGETLNSQAEFGPQLHSAKAAVLLKSFSRTKVKSTRPKHGHGW